MSWKTTEPGEHLSESDLLALSSGSLGERRALCAEHVKNCLHCAGRFEAISEPVNRVAEHAGETASQLPLADTRSRVADTEQSVQEQRRAGKARGELPSTIDTFSLDSGSAEGRPGESSATTSEIILSFDKSGSRLEDTTAPPDRCAALPIPAAAAQFGEYEILSEIARGGMGVVYKARQKRLNRVIALKMILAGQLASEQDVKRFYAEAEAAAALEHAGIVPIYEIGEQSGQHFFSMAFIEGRSLRAVIKEGPLPPQRAAELVQQVAEAVQYAHTKGIVHRDLKPHNILLDAEGRPKVTDFGLAKRMDAQEGLTTTGDILGTPNYMAPEQAQGKLSAIGPTTDVYALGAILYATLTGRPPIQAATLTDTLRQVVEQDPVAPRLLNSAIPRDLETVCLKALHKQPEKRYPSAHEFAEDLARFLRFESIVARPDSRFERLARWCRRNPAGAALAGVSLAAILLMLGLSQYFTYRLAVADGQTALREEQRKAAEQKSRAAEDLSKAQQYFAQLMTARDKIARQESGWPGESLRLIEQAAAIDTPSRNPTDLRTAVAACLSGVQLQAAGKIAEEFDSAVLAFHPLGNQLALAEARPRGLNQFSLRVRIVEFPAGKQLHELRFPTNVTQFARTGKPDRPARLLWSPDGRWLLVGSRFGTVHVFDMKSASSPPQSLDTGAIAYPATVFSRDSQFLFTAVILRDQPSLVKRWQLGAEIKELANREFGPVAELGVTADPDELLILERSRLVTASADTLEEKFATADVRGSEMAVHSHGRIALLAHDGRLDWRNPATHRSRGPLRSRRDEELATRGVRLIRWSPDGRLCMHQSIDSGLLEFWDPVSGENFAEWPNTGGTGYAEFDPTGKWVAVCGDFCVQLLEVVRFPEYSTAAVQYHAPIGLGMSPRGDRLVTIADAGPAAQPAELSIWNLDEQDGKLARPPQRYGFARHPDITCTAAFHPSGGDYVVAASFASLLEGFSNETHESIWCRNLLAPRWVSYTPDGKQLWVAQDVEVLVGTGDGEKSWKRWRNTWAALNNGGSLTRIAAGTDWVVVGDMDGMVYCFSTQLPATATDFKPVWSKLLRNLTDITAVALSIDQNWIYVGDRSGGFYRLQRSNQSIQSSAQHSQSLTAIVVLPDELLVTGSRDRSIRFWRWHGEEPEELFQLPTSGPVSQLSLTADGQKLAVLIAGERGVHLWNLSALRHRFEAMNLNFAPPVPPLKGQQGDISNGA